MAVRILSPDEQRRRSQAIGEAYSGWVKEQIAEGVDGPVPAGRMDGSDYNQHVPLMEATGEAMDDLYARVDEALRR